KRTTRSANNKPASNMAQRDQPPPYPNDEQFAIHRKSIRHILAVVRKNVAMSIPIPARHGPLAGSVLLLRTVASDRTKGAPKRNQRACFQTSSQCASCFLPNTRHQPIACNQGVFLVPRQFLAQCSIFEGRTQPQQNRDQCSYGHGPRRPKHER